MKIEVGEVGVVVELGFEEPEKVLGVKGGLKWVLRKVRRRLWLLE